jgi:hypothetical protein
MQAESNSVVCGSNTQGLYIRDTHAVVDAGHGVEIRPNDGVRPQTRLVVKAAIQLVGGGAGADVKCCVIGVS